MPFRWFLAGQSRHFCFWSRLFHFYYLKGIHIKLYKIPPQSLFWWVIYFKLSTRTPLKKLCVIRSDIYASALSSVVQFMLILCYFFIILFLHAMNFALLKLHTIKRERALGALRDNLLLVSLSAPYVLL